MLHSHTQKYKKTRVLQHCLWSQECGQHLLQQQSEVSTIWHKRGVTFLWHPQVSTSSCPNDTGLPGWENARMESRAEVLVCVLLGLQPPWRVEAPTGDWLHVEALPSCSFTCWDPRIIHCSVLCQVPATPHSPPHLYRRKKRNKWSPGRCNQASRCFQRKVSVRCATVWLRKTHYLTELHCAAAGPPS